MSVGLSNIAQRGGSVLDRLRETPLFDAVAALTLFLTIVFGFDNAFFRVASQVALLAVLLHWPLLRRTEFWAILAVVGTAVLIDKWYVADNHKYLLVYWLWVLTIASRYDTEAGKNRVLLFNARFFLVFIFLAAVLQKLFSPSYMSAAMFEMHLLLDERFKAFAHLMGIDKSVTDAALYSFATLQSPFTEVQNNEILLPASEHSRLLALVITWYDWLVQIFIGLLFIPKRRVTDLLAHSALLFFIVTTYLPAPVFGFGWTLAILGFTVAKIPFPRIAVGYLVACVAVILYQTPWREWVLGS